MTSLNSLEVSRLAFLFAFFASFAVKIFGVKAPAAGPQWNIPVRQR
jgi:hypothetical protein